jgi:hypothetical protein
MLEPIEFHMRQKIAKKKKKVDFYLPEVNPIL